ncbi:MAG: glycosyltransferase family 2 protein, partial [Planctomycetaceae bacterium]|nr:glycosyltransferase family 2 protein [Planctomycetaceae bacterium]
MSLTPDLVILIVAYRGRALLPGCLEALLGADSAGLTTQIVVVDNASHDGTVEWLRENHPQVAVLELPENLGFAGGNNRGWEWAAERFPSVKYLALVNQDVTVDLNWLRPLIVALDADESLASVQPTVLLDPPRDTINTLGTRSHYLGFGFPIGYRQPLAELPATTHRVDSVSGSACILRTELARQYGLFDARLFMYL